MCVCVCVVMGHHSHWRKFNQLNRILKINQAKCTHIDSALTLNTHARAHTYTTTYVYQQKFTINCYQHTYTHTLTSARVMHMYAGTINSFVQQSYWLLQYTKLLLLLLFFVLLKFLCYWLHFSERLCACACLCIVHACHCVVQSHILKVNY